GLPRPVQMAVAYGELLCGLLLLVGFLTRLAALAAVAMAGLECAVYGLWKNGFALLDAAGRYNGGFEYTLILLLLCLAVLPAGAGTFSLDGLLFGPRARKQGNGQPLTALPAD